MKSLITLLLCLFAIHGYSQRLEELGKDNHPTLTAEESQFLMTFISNEQLLGVDLTGKKVIFVTAPGGSQLGNKTAYFEEIKKYQQENRRIATSIVELDDKEKGLSGGYDVIITYWVKILTNKSKKKLLRQVNNPIKG